MMTDHALMLSCSYLTIGDGFGLFVPDWKSRPRYHRQREELLDRIWSEKLDQIMKCGQNLKGDHDEEIYLIETSMVKSKKHKVCSF